MRITRTTVIPRDTRIIQIAGMYDLPDESEQTLQWEPDLPLDEQEWNIGLIVGPSGAGKTTVASELFGITRPREWGQAPLISELGPGRSVRDVVEALNSVGFSSPPAWMRPYGVLSTGERFRADIAEMLMRDDAMIVVDEFTSTVDRVVAQVGSAALAKSVRANGRRMVAVTCHYDVLDWLQPDWTYEPHVNEFTWRSVQPRPQVECDVARTNGSEWPLFAPHHYLSRALPYGHYYVARFEGRPVAFCSVRPAPLKGQKRPVWRISRLVTDPDYQGIGVGSALLDLLAGSYKGNNAVYITSSHPAMIRRLSRSPLWSPTRKPGVVAAPGQRASVKQVSAMRMTGGFRYRGPALDNEIARQIDGPVVASA
jgi:GNAT superfamily N-acetyltransferase